MRLLFHPVNTIWLPYYNVMHGNWWHLDIHWICLPPLACVAWCCWLVSWGRVWYTTPCFLLLALCASFVIGWMHILLQVPLVLVCISNAGRGLVWYRSLGIGKLYTLCRGLRLVLGFPRFQFVPISCLCWVSATFILVRHSSCVNAFSGLYSPSHLRCSFPLPLLHSCINWLPVVLNRVCVYLLLWRILQHVDSGKSEVTVVGRRSMMVASVILLYLKNWNTVG